MSERIPQSVAKRVVFRAYLASDGKTLATGKTIAITISKNGGAFGNPAAGATNATEISSGFYYFDLGTGDTGTKGPLAWRGAEASIDDAGDVYEVSNATNAGFTALPDAAADAAGGLPISDAGGLDLDARLDAAVSSRAPASTALSTSQWTNARAGYLDNINNAALGTTASQSGDAYARLGAPAGASVSADIAAAKVVVDAVKVKTDYLPSATAGSAGGVMIAGSNAATTLASLTITGLLDINDGIDVSTSTSDRAGIKVRSNGTGAAVDLLAEIGLSLASNSGDYPLTLEGVDISAFIRGAVGLASADLDAQLGDAYTAILGVKTKTDYLPSATAGSAGGVMIAGSNAATTLASLTVTGLVDLNDGVDIAVTTTNRAGLKIAGNGSGAAMTLTPGATGTGLAITGGATSGAAVTLESIDAAPALSIIGATHGVSIEAYGSNGSGLEILAYNGNGIRTTGAFSYNGVQSIGGISGHGAQFIGGDGGSGLVCLGSDGGTGALFMGNGAGHGLSVTGGATGRGLNAVGGSTSGDAAVFTAQGGNSRGMLIQGQGSNDGLEITGGATGIGLDVNGGSSSGVGMTVDSTSGDAMQITAGGGNGDGIQIAGNGSGHGIRTTGGATGNGLTASGGATSGHGAAFDASNSGYYGVAVDGAPLDAAMLAAISLVPTAEENADAVWDEPTSGHSTGGTTGAAIIAAGSAGDPWSTSLPGAYSAGTAGHIVGNRLDAAVSTRSTYAGGDTAGTTTLLSRLTATRAGYLDNLSGGAVALASSILDAGDIRAALGMASANLDTQIAALPSASSIWSHGTRVLTAGTNIVLVKGVGVTGFNDLSAAGIRSAVGLDADDLDDQLAALPTAAEIATAVLTTQMTESYRANGAAPTLAQAQCEILGHLGESANSGTTKTVRKFDHATTAAEFEYDDDTNPSSITRTA